MKKFLIGLSFLNFAFSNAYATSSNEEEKVSITYKGRPYEISSVEASYAQIFRPFTKPFTPQGEVKELSDKFKDTLRQGKKSLEELQKNLKEEIKKCEEITPLYTEFRKFEYSETLGENITQEAFFPPTITTTNSVRITRGEDSCAVQKCITKSLVALNSSTLMNLVKKNTENDSYTAEQSQCINDMNENLKNFFQSYTEFQHLGSNNQKEAESKEAVSKEAVKPAEIKDSENTAYLIFDSSTIFTEGGKEDPEHKISLSNITLFPKDNRKALEALKERELGAPIGPAFTKSTTPASTTPKIYTMLLYPPEGETIEREEWGVKEARRVAIAFQDRGK